jgi:hypothetical protein
MYKQGFVEGRKKQVFLIYAHPIFKKLIDSVYMFFLFINSNCLLYKPFEKYLSSVLSGSSTMAQVPCLVHSCFQKSSLGPFSWTSAHWASNLDLIGSKAWGSKGRVELQSWGPWPCPVEGQMP